jgi:hypothetical protein
LGNCSNGLHGWALALIFVVLGRIGWPALASTSPPHEYYVLSPEPLTGAITSKSGGQPLDHALEWKGVEDADTNDILVSAERSYTFVIQATSVASGSTPRYRGALQLRR